MDQGPEPIDDDHALAAARRQAARVRRHALALTLLLTLAALLLPA